METRATGGCACGAVRYELNSAPPDAVAPGFHIFHASRIAWFETADTLPRHDRFRRDTIGLEGTEPRSSPSSLGEGDHPKGGGGAC